MCLPANSSVSTGSWTLTRNLSLSILSPESTGPDQFLAYPSRNTDAMTSCLLLYTLHIYIYIWYCMYVNRWVDRQTDRQIWYLYIHFILPSQPYVIPYILYLWYIVYKLFCTLLSFTLSDILVLEEYTPFSVSVWNPILRMGHNLFTIPMVRDL